LAWLVVLKKIIPQRALILLCRKYSLDQGVRYAIEFCGHQAKVLSTMEFINSLLNPIDAAKPSLFELLSEQQLSGLLPPSLRYLLALATHRRPRYLLRVLNSFDEVYALLSLIVEKYYLEKFGGSFTENFYELKRERVLRIRGGEVPRAQLAVPGEVREKLKLGKGDVWKNLAVLVGLPYLKRKLDESYDVHIAPSASLLMSGSLGGPQYLDRDALPPNPTLKQRFMWLYKLFLQRCYPTLNAAYYFGILAFSLAYLFDGTKYSSPFLWMIGTRMRRMGEADYKAIALADAATPPAAAGRPGQGLSGIFSPRTIYPRLLSSLKILLPASIFALKFLEWWHASDFSRQLSRKAAEGLELPPPMVSGMTLEAHLRRTNKEAKKRHGAMRPENKSGVNNAPVSSTTYLPIFTVPPPLNSDLCPICLHPTSTAAACQTGYVYDYKCIFQWIEGTHERQEAFMRGDKMSEWEDEGYEEGDVEEESKEEARNSKVGKWENGSGRCAVTGRRVLGGTSGLRRVMV
jgi:peroxin-12